MRLKEIVDRVQATLVTSRVSPRAIRHIKTGIDSLDKFLGGGILRAGITQIFGPAGAGKTAFAYQLIKANPDLNVLYIDVNRSVDLLLMKRFGVNPDAENLAFSRIYDIEHFEEYARTILRMNIFDLVIIDDLASIHHDPDKSASKMLNDLKASISSAISQTNTAVLIINQARTKPLQGFVPYADNTLRIEGTILFVDRVGVLNQRHSRIGIRSRLWIYRSRYIDRTGSLYLDVHYEGIKDVREVEESRDVGGPCAEVTLDGPIECVLGSEGDAEPSW